MPTRYLCRRSLVPVLGLLLPLGLPLAAFAADSDQDGVGDDLEVSLGLDPANATSFAGRPDWTGCAGTGIPGHLLQQVFPGVAGGAVKDLTAHPAFRTGMATRSLAASVSVPAPAASGMRLAGLFTAPVAGTYRFSLSADDTAQLWLGSDASPFSRTLAVSVGSWTALNSFADARSVSVTLAEGQSIWFEVLAKNSGGAGHVAVGWKRPGAKGYEVLPGTIPMTGKDGAAVRVPILSTPPFNAKDADSNGLPDDWEVSSGLNPTGDATLAGTGAYDDPDGDGVSNLCEYQISGNPRACGGDAGRFTRELWTDIAGQYVRDFTASPRAAQAPNGTTVVAGDFSSPDLGDSYFERLRAVLTAPRAGLYEIALTADNGGELWLSDTTARSGKRRVATVADVSGADEWTKYATQTVQVWLDPAKPVFAEILHKESRGAAHAKVAWRHLARNWCISAAGEPAVTATQSSTYDGKMTADRAIDGDTSGNPSSASFSHTKDEANSWWKVDFGATREIGSIDLWNRTDAGHGQRLSNFRVSVLDAAGATLASRDFFVGSGHAGAQTTWTLPAPVQGRTVRVELLGRNNLGNGILTLAEVQVFAPSAVPARTVIPASALSTAPADPADTDGDSLADAWERQHFSDLSATEYGDPDGDGMTNVEEQSFGTDPRVATGRPGCMRMETWFDVPGGALRDGRESPKRLGRPDRDEPVYATEAGDAGDTFVRRMRATLRVPETGDYTFWISSDVSSVLNLSTSGRTGMERRKFHKQTIARMGPSERNSTSFSYRSRYREWTHYPFQESLPLHLEAGKDYFVEVLHKALYGTSHVEIAWARDGAAPVPIPVSAMTFFAGDEADADDDDLPDDWETAHGLSPKDNGRTDFLREGAEGDFDADGLSNQEEYQLGTNPARVDTDGDGMGDADEAHAFGSSPLEGADAGVGAPVVSLPGDQAKVVSGVWTRAAIDALLCIESRGTLDFPFTLDAAGFFLYGLSATPVGEVDGVESIPFEILVDGVRVAKPGLRSPNGGTQVVHGLLPHLAAGPHTLTVRLLNMNCRKTVRIDNLGIHAAAGADGDGDGIPDWILARLRRENVLRVCPAESRVSPVCIEGMARILEGTRLLVDGVAQPLVAGPDKSWFANVPLSASGPKAVRAQFEGGHVEVQVPAVAWVPFDLAREWTVGSTPVGVRLGDAMRLTALPSGIPAGDVASVTFTELAAGGAVHRSEVRTRSATVDPAEPVAWTFTQAGGRILRCSIVKKDGTVLQAAEVPFVVQVADFGPAFPVICHRSREWVLPNVQGRLDADTRLRIGPIPATSGQRVRVSVEGDDALHVYARIDGSGAIMGRGTVVPLSSLDATGVGYMEYLMDNPDGSSLARIIYLADKLPEGGGIRMRIKTPNVTFFEGGTQKTFTAADVQENGFLGVFYLSLKGRIYIVSLEIEVLDAGGNCIQSIE